MAYSSTPASEARKQVGKYLVNQRGYAKRTETRFYKKGGGLLAYVYFERSRGITQVEIGVMPLYVPESYWLLNGRTLTELQLPFLLEDAVENEAQAWAEKAIACLQSGCLDFAESLCSPRKLLDYLQGTTALRRQFIKPQLQADKLIAYSAAYLGDTAFAAAYARKAKERVPDYCVDAISPALKELDVKIAQLRNASVSKKPWIQQEVEAQIAQCEREKQLKIGDAQENAPRMIAQYEQWIAPFSAPDFDREAYFAHIIAQNKAALKYDKLFPA